MDEEGFFQESVTSQMGHSPKESRPWENSSWIPSTRRGVRARNALQPAVLELLCARAGGKHCDLLDLGCTRSSR